MAFEDIIQACNFQLRIPDPTCSNIDIAIKMLQEISEKADQISDKTEQDSICILSEFISSKVSDLEKQLELLRKQNGELRDGFYYSKEICKAAAKAITELQDQIQQYEEIL